MPCNWGQGRVFDSNHVTPTLLHNDGLMLVFSQAGLDFSRHKKEGIDPGRGSWEDFLIHSLRSSTQLQQLPRHLGPEVGKLILGRAARPELGDFRRPDFPRVFKLMSLDTHRDTQARRHTDTATATDLAISLESCLCP